MNFGVTFLGGVGLARLLTPSEMGGVVGLLFVASLSKTLVDGGLGASLVQQEDPPTADEVNRVCTAQLWIALVIAALVALVAVGMGQLESGRGFAAPLAVAAVSITAMGFTSTGMALLERSMAFGRLGVAMTVQPLVFYGASVAIAALGGSLMSIAFVLVVSQFLTAAASVLLSGWRPALLRPAGELRRRLRFGAPLILSSAISALKDAVNPVALGLLLGATSVAYVNVAQQVAAAGTYLMFVMARVYLPLFSRLRNDPIRLGDYVAAACYWANVMVAPVGCFAVLNANQILIQVYGPAWSPATDTLQLLVIANLVAPAGTVLMWMHNAKGRTSLPLAYAVAYFVLTWALVPALCESIGLLGYGVANVIVSAATIGLLIQSRDVLPARRFFRAMTPWPVAAFATWCVTAAFEQMQLRESVMGLTLLGCASALLFMGLLRALDGRNVVEGLRHLVRLDIGR